MIIREGDRSISFYAVSTSTGRAPRRLLPRVVEVAARSAVVTHEGASFPCFKRASDWRAEEDGDGAIFRFEPRSIFRAERERSLGAEVMVMPDGTIQATRQLTHEEADGPVIILGALIAELAFDMAFVGRLMKKLGRDSTRYRVGLELLGLDGAVVDWGGFAPSPTVHKGETAMPKLWRFRPPVRLCSFDGGGVSLPILAKVDTAEVVSAIVKIVAELTSLTVGSVRRPWERPEDRNATTLLLEEDGVAEFARRYVKLGLAREKARA